MIRSNSFRKSEDSHYIILLRQACARNSSLPFRRTNGGIPMDAQVAEASYVDLSTGLDSSGNIQHKGGSLDANWTVTGAVNPLDAPNAYVVSKRDADWYGGWAGYGPHSSWIAANPNDAYGNGLMTFTDTFDVA